MRPDTKLHLRSSGERCLLNLFAHFETTQPASLLSKFLNLFLISLHFFHVEKAYSHFLRKLPPLPSPAQFPNFLSQTHIKPYSCVTHEYEATAWSQPFSSIHNHIIVKTQPSPVSPYIGTYCFITDVLHYGASIIFGRR